ncbi:MAG TPA: hypothetical protein PKZ41_01715, partial [Candidatus Omnitrophota bacterium]|nr:hypothetical protein [Candidatus Omnitrophota bacterium]
VNLLAIIVIIYGCLLVFRPEVLRKIFDRAKEGSNIYIASSIKGVAGLILIFSAGASRVPWVVMLIGSLMLFGGILAFVIKKNFITGIIDWMEQQPPRFTYYVGGSAILIGAILALAA